MKYTPETPKAILQQPKKPTEKTPKLKKEQPNNHKGAQNELQEKTKRPRDNSQPTKATANPTKRGPILSYAWRKLTRRHN
jgi:hypothetical protein